MKFSVYSRQAVEALPHLDEPHLFISITLNGMPEATLQTNEHTKGVLRLAFWDLESVIDDSVDEATLYSNQQAEQVAAFVKQHKDEVSLIILHCDAGLSRSPGMAAALAKALNNDDSFYFAGGKRPNMRVYRKTLNACFDAGLITGLQLFDLLPAV